MFNGYIRQCVRTPKIVIFVRTYREQIMFILSQQIKYSKQKLHLIYVIIKKRRKCLWFILVIFFFGTVCCYYLLIEIYWPTPLPYITWLFIFFVQETFIWKYYMIEVQLHPITFCVLKQINKLCLLFVRKYSTKNIISNWISAYKSLNKEFKIEELVKLDSLTRFFLLYHYFWSY